MTLYGWSGPGKLREMGLDRAVTPEITEPSDPGVSEAELMKFYQCTVDKCGKRFKVAMLIARHFNSSHEGLKKDKDSWREFNEEIWE